MCYEMHTFLRCADKRAFYIGALAADVLPGYGHIPDDPSACRHAQMHEEFKS